MGSETLQTKLEFPENLRFRRFSGPLEPRSTMSGGNAIWSKRGSCAFCLQNITDIYLKYHRIVDLSMFSLRQAGKMLKNPLFLK